MEDEDQLWELLWDLMDSPVECAFCPTELDQENTKVCIECGRPACSDCLHEIFVESYCPECCICKVCGSEAVFACDKCSKLCCPEHVHERVYREHDTNFEDVSLLCDKCLDEGRN